MGNQRTTEGPEDASIDESRETLLGGRDPKPGIFGRNDLIVFAIAIAVACLAASTLDRWALWVVLAGIVVVVIGVMIAVSPNRPRA